MEGTPLDQPAVNETAAVPPQTAQRRMRKPLVLGLLVGFLPLALTPGYYLVSALQQTFETYPFPEITRWFELLLALYGVGWVGAILLRTESNKQSHRIFAKGMMIGLAGIVALLFWAFVGLIILLVIGCRNGCGLAG